MNKVAEDLNPALIQRLPSGAQDRALLLLLPDFRLSHSTGVIWGGIWVTRRSAVCFGDGVFEVVGGTRVRRGNQLYGVPLWLRGLLKGLRVPLRAALPRG